MGRKKLLLGLGIIALVCMVFNVAEAKDKDSLEAQGAPQKEQAIAAAPDQTAGEQKQALINNFTILQNREARVVVLQQLLNREMEEMRKMEAAFCDNYKLDVDKWRRGGYIYDEKEGKFVERKDK